MSRDRDAKHHLPTPRTLLTNLINAISNIPLTPQQPSDSKPDQSRRRLIHDPSPPGNPLRHVSPSHRHLIITLHALFPGMVLPALDLLERGCVSRVVLKDRPHHHAGGRATYDDHDENNDDGDDEHDTPDAQNDGVRATEQTQVGTQGRKGRIKRKSPSFYLVTSSSSSSASTTTLSSPAGDSVTHHLNRGSRRLKKLAGEYHHHHHHEGATAGTGTATGTGLRRYLVRLGAWNCTCAAFAFAAVQGGTPLGEGEGGADAGMGGGTETEMDWSFGGMAMDGLGVEGGTAAAAAPGGGVPLCKHLLACMLAERWSAALGRYVVTRRVAREEMAGIVADV
ncbi:hypothetical protein N656DRAFT_780937 [Canariomyces notabilis]|uniref:SWIM-type domain-containing protein n=1 Tax=Canariomyces notabilis TaxID=2074819 RepID=A0AAN6TB62_9PEZI|nr:hypothetical protein N656DRAFT_780937 [Canariomyces arenarius]